MKKLLLPATLISGVVFSALTLPLAVLGSEAINIKVQNEEFFSGQVREIAAPYVSLATALSLASGVASVSVAGWRQSSLKSSRVQENLSQLQQQLHDKEESHLALKLSESQLKASGLAAFLEDTGEVEALGGVASVTAAMPVVVDSPLVASPVVVAIKDVPTPSPIPTKRPLTVTAATSSLAAAQAYVSFARSSTAVQEPTMSARDGATVKTSKPSVEQVQALQNQLEQIMAEISMLKAVA